MRSVPPSLRAPRRLRRAGAVLIAVVVLLSGFGPARPATAATRVTTRTLLLARGADRPLPTTVWYPSPLTGRHPLILFSHGLGGTPSDFAPLIAGWAEAGYLVAAPAYPHTNRRVPVVRPDVRSQPADALYVVDQVRRLSAVPGDVFSGHVDAARWAAVGFSAGGTTTLGLFGPGHDPRLRAGVSIAGREAPAGFGGWPAPLLFVHGNRDPVVPIGAARRAYGADPWPKRFVTVRGAGHGEYLRPGNPSYDRIAGLIRAFLAAQLPT
ncbi:alpha/beta hydrolase family protein [Actinoplanes sp. NPDC048988]|uniref:alpha/beta hydrolase family protein n=1 Tax=Actinoplanes sp. NPDC048988 TaxID=3363901 RepID=UPI00371B0296